MTQPTIPIAIKTAHEDRNYELNLGPIMNRTDTIAAITSITPEDGITVSNPTHDASVLKFQVSGGEERKDYTINIRFTTNSQPLQNLETSVIVQVRGEVT